MSRREFLYYVWGASLALLLTETAGLLIWFLIPRFRFGEFGGTFTVPANQLPGVNEPPVNYAGGRFWLVNLSTISARQNERMYLVADENNVAGVVALYKVCTHLGCIYDWTPANERFECPCHGSKYRLDGRRIVDPAPRSLDRFAITAVDAAGRTLASTAVGSDGQFLPLTLPAGTEALQIDTGIRQQGASLPLLCDEFGVC